MTNPFNFSRGISGKSNNQIYADKIAQLQQNDLAQAQGLNQLSERDLNTQIYGNRDNLAAAFEGMNPRQQEAAMFGLSNPDQMAQIMENSRMGNLQDNALNGSQYIQNNAHAFNKSSAIFDQTGAGTRLNNFSGEQSVSDLDIAKAFDFNQQGAKRGNMAQKPFTPSDMNNMRDYYFNKDGGASIRLQDALSPSTEGAAIAPEALAYAQKRITELASQGMPVAQIYSTIDKELAQGLTYNDGGWLGGEGTTFNQPVFNPATGKTGANQYADIPDSFMQGRTML